jgi:AraC-like DNA-binding protein
VLTEPRREILIPNGRPTILVCLAEPGSRIAIATGAEVRNASNLAGVLTKPVLLQQTGRSVYVAAQLHPWGLSAFLPGEPLVDRTLALEAWIGPAAASSLTVRLRAIALGLGAVAELAAVLEMRLQPLPPAQLSQVTAAIAAIDAAPDAVVIEQLHKRLGVSYPALYRLFKTHLGISPKRYAAIRRYYQLVGSLLTGEREGGLAQLALLQGFYDQAHASRDFLKFTGVTQSTFRKTLNGVARLMHGA